MNRRGLLLCAGALALAGCATGPLPSTTGKGADPSELEALYAVTPGRDGLVVRVASNGCTTKEDFAFYVERKGALPALAFGRRRLDTCRSFVAAEADLAFSWAELGLTPRDQFALLNPLTTFPGP
jgi:hypothetical protein